jgi:hypothetical protein
MKELSIKQKAEAYDEVRQKIAIRFGSNVANEIFSQFEMSEDEKIRKNIVSFINGTRFTEPNTEERLEWISWLEKQEVLTPEEDLQGKEDVLWCIKQAMKYAKDENEMGTCWFAEKWLEKQGKSKPTLSDEDERMRNAAINACKYMVDNFENSTKQYEDAIIWLEKQGEQKPTIIIPKFRVGDWVVDKNGTVQQILSYKNGVYKHTNGYSATIFEDEWRMWNITKDAKDGDVLATDDWVFIFKELNAYGKPVCYCHYDDELGFKVDVNSYLSTGSEIYPATKEQRDLLFTKMKEAGYEWDTENKQLKRIEEKSVDKVEPKFHEGDWILHQGTDDIYQVVAVIDDKYRLKYGDNYTIQNCTDVERCARLWDVTKDAKDGDVLYTSSTASNEVFIFKGLTIEGYIECYCSYDSEDKYREGKYHFIGKPTFMTHPATKEQRDLLFQKMKEAGYEWDADKKESMKMDQKPAWNEEDENKVNNLCVFLDQMVSFIMLGNKDATEFKDWLKSLKYRVQSQRSIWTKGDDVRFTSTMQVLEYSKSTPDYNQYGIDDIRNNITWLKSLKDRVQPQTQWKPSDEQMKALSAINITGGISYAGQGQELINLFSDLKKLREE